tara:strand:+ start:1114 stop:3882 length:2769 start_codon:yes stop_codon:yes gene_type:complete
MKKLVALAILVTSIAGFSQSKQQQFEVSGTLITADDNVPLEAATVYLQRVKDSSLVTYTITDQKGEFTLEGTSFDPSLNLFISYIGYKTYTQNISLEKPEQQLGQINLQVDDNLLDEVVVKATAPITVKKDTLEFNVASFTTKKDANVEDLLKKLPGVEIDENGKITANGKDVSNIYVNGKPFFGDDPTITTRSLTKEMIEKVQITDTKTKAQAFTGEESDSENKTINLTIREDKNKGVFGRVSAGGGTDDRYEGAGMLNLFDNDQRISILAGGNNTNSVGFSFGEIEKMFGGSGSFDSRSFGGGSGITTSKNAGFNYADDLSKKIEISADYFYSNSHSEDKNATQRENIIPDNRYFTDSNSSSFNDTYSHRANVELEVELDSTLRIDIEPSFSASKNSRSYERDEESRDDEGVVTNESNSDSFVENIGNNFRNEFDITKRIGSKGAFLRVGIDNEISKTTSDDFLNSQTEVYGNSPESVTRNQYTDGVEEVNRLTTNLTYRVPLKGEELSLDIRYTYFAERQNNTESTYDFDDATQEFDDFNTALSTDYKYKNNRSVPGLRLSYRKDKISVSGGGDYLFRTLENSDGLRPELSLKREFKAVEAYARFRYRFSPKASLSFRYSLDNSPPSVRQLQPFVDVSNPLNTVVGNPNLKPRNSHDFSLYANNHDYQKGVNFFTYIRADIDNNQVVSKTTIDENFVRNTTYANVDGTYSLRGGGELSRTKRIDTVKTIKVGVGLFGNLNKSINFNNDVEYASTNTSLSPSLNVTFTWKDVMEITPRYSVSFTKNKFDLEQFNTQEFKYHNLGINTATFLPKNFEWRNDINYNYNPNIADDFQKSAWFWNATLSYSIIDNNGMLSLKAYDLLNQNTNARRIASGNYIQDSQSTVLQQYFMLSFSWKFNSLGQAGEVDDRGSRHYRRGTP